MYKNNQCIGGYHGIHEVNYLQNIEEYFKNSFL